MYMDPSSADKLSRVRDADRLCTAPWKEGNPSPSALIGRGALIREAHMHSSDSLLASAQDSLFCLNAAFASGHRHQGAIQGEVCVHSAGIGPRLTTAHASARYTAVPDAILRQRYARLHAGCATHTSPVLASRSPQFWTLLSGVLRTDLTRAGLSTWASWTREANGVSYGQR